MFLCIFSLITSKLPPPPPPPTTTTTECVLFHVYQFSHTPCYVTTSTEGRFLVFYEQFEHHQLSQIEINFSNNKYSLFFHVHKPSTYTLLRWIKVHGWLTNFSIFWMVWAAQIESMWPTQKLYLFANGLFYFNCFVCIMYWNKWSGLFILFLGGDC